MKIYFNTNDVATVFGVTADTVRHWVEEGKLNGRETTRVGGTVFTLADMLGFMRSVPEYSGEEYYFKLMIYPEEIDDVSLETDAKLLVDIGMLVGVIKVGNENPNLRNEIEKDLV